MRRAESRNGVRHVRAGGGGQDTVLHAVGCICAPPRNRRNRALILVLHSFFYILKLVFNEKWEGGGSGWPLLVGINFGH